LKRAAMWVLPCCGCWWVLIVKNSSAAVVFCVYYGGQFADSFVLQCHRSEYQVDHREEELNTQGHTCIHRGSTYTQAAYKHRW
jgi:hypothetical protein